MAKSRFRWVVLGLSWFSWLLLGIALLSLGVMLVKLVPQFGLTGVQAGALMAVSAIPAIVFAIPIGSLADRYGGRRLGALGLLMLMVGLILIAIAEVFLVLIVARLAIGIGAALCGTPLQQWITKWFPSTELGFALGFLSSGYGIGSIIGIFTMGYILETLDLFLVTVVLGIVCLICMFLFLLARQEHPLAIVKENGTSETSLSLRMISKVFRTVELWKLGIAGFAITGIMSAYATFAPITFVVQFQMDIVTASATAGIAAILGTPFIFAGGWLSDKLKPRFERKTLVFVATLICAFAFYLIGVATVFFIALIGICLIGIFNWISSAALSAACTESTESATVGCALGFLAAICSIGSLILPLTMGLVFDMTGSWALTWTVPAIVAFIGAIVVLFSKN
ncbi:nitrate/nitrite transporter [Candidatus Borrarchaeum sp.]|uniref:MFS transporter n=1 Tax=Candidatus Borrarchaeum sp. TaxID=2846742 RepID=UPI0025801486|nr:MFS transporter [Candidatus Borrarchaeum sp.]